MIRRLDPDKDEALYREVFSWELDVPEWYAASSNVWRPDLENFLAQTREPTQIDIGVWDKNLCGLITVTWRAKGRYEAHLWAKRGTSLEILEQAGQQVMNDMFQRGMIEAFVWVAERNLPVKKLCEHIGLFPDGVVMYRGAYRGRVIKWLRFSCVRQAMAKVA